MSNIAIPKFDKQNKLHARIAELSQKAHLLVVQDKDIEAEQEEIDEAVERLWNIKS